MHNLHEIAAEPTCVIRSLCYKSFLCNLLIGKQITTTLSQRSCAYSYPQNASFENARHRNTDASTETLLFSSCLLPIYRLLLDEVCPHLPNAMLWCNWTHFERKNQLTCQRARQDSPTGNVNLYCSNNPRGLTSKSFVVFWCLLLLETFSKLYNFTTIVEMRLRSLRSPGKASVAQMTKWQRERATCIVAGSRSSSKPGHRRHGTFPVAKSATWASLRISEMLELFRVDIS